MSEVEIYDKVAAAVANPPVLITLIICIFLLVLVFLLLLALIKDFPERLRLLYDIVKPSHPSRKTTRKTSQRAPQSRKGGRHE